MNKPLVSIIITCFNREKYLPSAARNHGLKLAEGQYIKIIDSDDILVPKAIECKVQALTHFQADVSACGK
ncbi:glycosyltransferase [Coleofasciculus sp.]|uniref:glycosyltransferase n=1 Tax=Coleofasciculus sp. TaxID=3100458 RepID=UPI0039F803E5